MTASITARLTRPILTLIFSLVESPEELALTCTTFHNISKTDLLRASWLHNHFPILTQWATHPEKTDSTFPSRLITPAVASLLLDTLQNQLLNNTATNETRTVVLALWTLVCTRRYTDVMTRVVTIDASGLSTGTPGVASLARVSRRASVTVATQKSAPGTASATAVTTPESPFIALFDAQAWKVLFEAAVQ
ncbi:hypothetical protein HDU98_005465, partial [Podochytrium sp. JEL0797]